MKTTIIKHTALAIFLLLTVGLVGCGDDGDIYNITASKMLVGKWKLVKVGNIITTDDIFIIIKANGSCTCDHWNPIYKSIYPDEENYTLLEDWAYDESKNLFRTVIQFTNGWYPYLYPFYCALKEEEMILVPKIPDGAAFVADPTQFYIKVK